MAKQAKMTYTLTVNASNDPPPRDKVPAPVRSNHGSATGPGGQTRLTVTLK